MRVFAVSGYSGRGKTSLIEAIIKELVDSGHSVASMKSSKHKEGPEQGSDTWKHKQAGASMSVFLGPASGSISLKDRLGADRLDELSKHDFLIVEGMKSVNIPRFWCVGDNEIGDIPTNTEAIVSWSDKHLYPGLEVPVYLADDIKTLVEIVKSKAVDISRIE